MDKLTKEQRRKNMQAVKSKGSVIEKTLMSALWQKGFRYRKNSSEIFGKPDIVFRKQKVAIFCDSEFWHGKEWPIKKNEHKTNKKFWHTKIKNNILRDIKVNKKLKQAGWTVLRFWGEEILKNTESCVKTIEAKLNEKQKNQL